MPRISTATAPTRVCDAGGWTDTWFAREGRVVNLAVEPRAVATVRATIRSGTGAQVRLRVRDYADDYHFDLDAVPDRHPLLEQSVVATAPPLDVEIACAAPPGASMGTSAAVVVALVGALSAAVGGRERMTPAGAAARAHHVETVLTGRQAGIQDQMAAAYGGACDIRVDDYPQATVTRIALPPGVAEQLDAAMVTVHLGSHDSSAVHRDVIAALEADGPLSPRLQRLRDAAAWAAAALSRGDLEAYAHALSENTAAQADLHPGLVGPAAVALIDMARAAGAIGWKVNGAGGSGGSVTVFVPRSEARDALVAEVQRRADWSLVPTVFAPVGLHVVITADANEGRP